MKCPTSGRSRDGGESRGFTLLEATVVLVLVSILGLASLGLSRPCCGGASTALAASSHAIAAFARVNGRLPCADVNRDGHEDCGAGPGAGTVPWRLLNVDERAVQPKGALLLYQPHWVLAQPASAGHGGPAQAHKQLQQRVQMVESAPLSTGQPYRAGHGDGYGNCAAPAHRLAYALVVVRDRSGLHLPCLPANALADTWVEAVDPYGVLTQAVGITQ